MQNINIGKSGIQVPFLGMGTWAIGGGAWWGDNDDSLSVKAIQTAVEQGIQWIDTAPIYGLYHSETVVGEAMKHIDRDKVVLSTKCGLEWRHETPVLHKVVDGTTVYRDLSAKSIIEDVEDSLRRLHTDHLDVLYTHWQTPDFGIYPLEETVEAMMKLKEQGKIRAIGASNVTADIIRGYCKYGQLDVIQEKYSLLTRRVEKQLLPTCKELGVSVQAYSPLEQGLLTGKVTMETTYPEGSTRNSNPSFQPERRSQALDMLAKWSDLTEKYDCSLAQLVIALTARMIPGLHVLCGARTPQQAFMATGPLSLLEHMTTGLRGPPTSIMMTCLGQMFAQAPQPVHLSLSTLATPSTMWIASNLHTLVQSPRPTQAKEQVLGPPYSAAAAAQVWMPL